LIQYERLIEKAAKQQLTSAEMNILIKKFDLGELYTFEQQRNLSITLLKKWLVKYKFKNWITTEERGLNVTQEMKQQRATEIAQKLNDTDFWHYHGRGIPMETLESDLNLRIDDT